MGIVAANNGTKVYDRKGFGDMAHAMSLFMHSHPDAYLYVHSLPRTFDGGELDILFQYKGIPRDRLRWVDPYDYKKQNISDDDMALRYSSFDVLLATSRGEGFGLAGARGAGMRDARHRVQLDRAGRARRGRLDTHGPRLRTPPVRVAGGGGS